jgi:hypothetical protein
MGRVVGGVTDLFHQASDAVSRMGRDAAPESSGDGRVRHIVVE